jgi:FkbM family methyltransferase
MIAQSFYSVTLRCLDSKSRAIRAIGMGVGLASPRLKRVISKFSDPSVSLPLGKKTLRMPFSHNLALYRRLYPSYDTAVTRIAAFLRDTRGRPRIIDVGANIGDSISLIADETDAEFLAIEADARFLPFLFDNVAMLQRESPRSSVVCEKCLIDEAGDGNVGNVSLVPNEKNAGTSFVSADAESSDSVPIWSLDRLVQTKHPSFDAVSLLKSDTDGYDFRVLRGSSTLLSSARPVLFFEFSPRHLVATGENPESVFPYLVEHGYSRALVYSHLGNAVAALSLDDALGVAELARYAQRRGTYYDVLTFPDSAREEFAVYRERELQLLKGSARGIFPDGWRAARSADRFGLTAR